MKKIVIALVVIALSSTVSFAYEGPVKAPKPNQSTAISTSGPTGGSPTAD